MMNVRRVIRFSAYAAAVLVAGAAAITTSGLVDVAASSGHWPVTRWLLHYTMRRSVAVHAIGIEAPDLDAEAMILRGAGHYATGCAPCHGAPGAPRDPIVRQMTPVVPALDADLDQWRDRELFWIVKHGIKYTAMPGWVAPAHDAEIWSVVAFLRILPGLTAEHYRELAYGRSQRAYSPGIEKFANVEPALPDCIRCHGRSGTGRGIGAFPKLDLQSETYLYDALASYARGARGSGIMQPVAHTLDAPSMRRLAQFYAQAPRDRASPDPAARFDPQTLARGRRIATRGVAERGIPACTHCHGPGRVAQNESFPALAGQHERYLVEQLELFNRGVRGGGPYARVMTRVADRLEPHQIRDVAAWFAALPSAPADD
jgi:cytochrome c553